LNNITVDGVGNFELCFNEAFDVMQKNEELIAGSQKAIMFFTDGTKTTSESSNRSYRKQLPAKLMAFGV